MPGYFRTDPDFLARDPTVVNLLAKFLMGKRACLPLALALLITATAGCGGGPYRRVDTGRDEGYVLFSGGRSSQEVYVDGVNRGTANDFDGKPDVLAVVPGVRDVEVRQDGRVILRQRVFIGTGTTKIFDLP